MYGIRSALFKYSVTTFEPGARLVFTQGFTCKPRRTALRASSPAAISTDGLEVLVQLVMAALTTEPWQRLYESPLGWRTGTHLPNTSMPLSGCSSAYSGAISMGWPPSANQRVISSLPRRAVSPSYCFTSACRNDLRTSVNVTRSCGRAGPARLGSTSLRSNSTTFEYTASGCVPSCQSPCAL